MSDWITMRRFHESEGVEDWRVVGEGASAYFRTGSFAAGAQFVNAISELARLEDHPPDVDLRHAGVIVRLITMTPEYCGLSERDLELARQISAVARKLGVPADPASVQTVQITIDALVGRRSGSRRWTIRRRRGTGFTSTSGCRRTRPKPGSPPRSLRAATLSRTSTRPPGGRCRTPRATSPTWRRRRAATERSLPDNEGGDYCASSVRFRTVSALRVIHLLGLPGGSITSGLIFFTSGWIFVPGPMSGWTRSTIQVPSRRRFSRRTSSAGVRRRSPENPN